MAIKDIQTSVFTRLSNLKSNDDAAKLFASILNYEYNGKTLSTKRFPSSLDGRIKQVQLLAGHDDFKVLHCEVDKLQLGIERPIINNLLKDHPYSLFLFSDASKLNWHFINVKYDEEESRRKILRRIVVGPDERLHTAAQRLAMLELPDDRKLTPLDLQQKHDQAFDVEAVTEKFFYDYREVFGHLRDILLKQTKDRKWAHDSALQFMNRMMFLYFIQKKAWLGNNKNFMNSLWNAYKKGAAQKDTFLNDWLFVLFFEAFNNKYQDRAEYRKRFPRDIHSSFAAAPFLNGGLFSENDLDRLHNFAVPDSFFVELFDRFDNSSPGFLQRYNFTVAEDTPLDQEVAVDPEMIGKVYESLVNNPFEATTEIDQRGDSGIFYTPRVEIDLMCRLAVTDWLTNHLGQEYKTLIRRAVFAYTPEEKDTADKALLNQNILRQMYELLIVITVLDPACGSGSFLVGMLLILDDLQLRLGRILGINETSYERRKRIIAQSLYGVDVMDWAVPVAELRLWLQLVVETELEPAELKFRPLLPNLSFKVRCGDSLVQQVAGINFGVHRHHLDLSATVKGKLTALKGEKLKYFHGQYKDTAATRMRIEMEEIKLFSQILHEKKIILEKQIIRLKDKIANPNKGEQLQLAGIGRSKPTQLRLEAADWERQLEEVEEEHSRLSTALQALTKTNEVPFVWDVAFVEIFEGDTSGFDIIVGNPPYVRQEKIADPRAKPSDFGGENSKRWKAKKAEYKAALQRSVYEAFPKFFGYNSNKGTVGRKLDGKCDLYVYFYLHGLSLLNEKGSFSFITSNSWMDVGYGADLQEFLLKHCQIKLILDNEAKRSFKQADVNTVICLFSAPVNRKTIPTFDARFAMFKVAFEYALSPVVFEEIEEATDRLRREEFRVVVRKQEDLYEEGLDPTEGEYEPHAALRQREYAGDKWGGKYLRAPDIFYTILEKGKDKLVRLGDIAQVRRGFTTGANEFFYLDDEKTAEWEIEKEFLKPVIKSPKECRTILISPNQLKHKLFICHEEKGVLKGTRALKYIEWGEKQGYSDVQTVSGRARWYDLGVRSGSRINCNYLVNEVMRFYYTAKPLFVSDNFQEVHSTEHLESIVVSLNSVVFGLMVNMMGRANFGGGLMKIQTYEVANLQLVHPQFMNRDSAERILKQNSDREMVSAFDEFGIDARFTIRSQKPNPLPVRKALDDIVFDALGLTQAERNEVYYAVCELVQNRLNKAKSV